MLISKTRTDLSRNTLSWWCTFAAVLCWSGAAAAGATININIKVGQLAPLFEDQGQKTVRVKNNASRIVWHCNGCDGTQPLSISFTNCFDEQNQPQACPASPIAESDKKSVFDVSVEAALEGGKLDYVIKVGEQEVDPSIIVTRER
ncbi:MAG: hypothetical protein ACOY3E_12850 [Pseudomonadota bacterium]